MIYGSGSRRFIKKSGVGRQAQVIGKMTLYAYPRGSLYQPVYLGKRDDIEPAACIIRQLKLKPVDSGN
jgi:hypothetical protein